MYYFENGKEEKYAKAQMLRLQVRILDEIRLTFPYYSNVRANKREGSGKHYIALSIF